MRDRDDESALPEALVGRSWRRCDIYEAPEWYDVDYAGYRGEESFYRFLLERIEGTIVELGAGTGRLALAFAAEGRRVHAVEPAPAMRARLLDKRARSGLGAERLSVEDARAADFRGGDDIAAVLFPFNGVLHLHDVESLSASFAHVHARLGPGGMFALDCTGPYWDAMLYGPTSWGRSDERIHPETGSKVLTCDRSRYDPATRCMHIDVRYIVDGAAAGVQIELVQRMWTWQQVLGALARAGFVVEHCFGDVNLAPFDEGSPRLLVAARKQSA
jgi:SAM-dependent methyltransferase